MDPAVVLPRDVFVLLLRRYVGLGQPQVWAVSRLWQERAVEAWRDWVAFAAAPVQCDSPALLQPFLASCGAVLARQGRARGEGEGEGVVPERRLCLHHLTPTSGLLACATALGASQRLQGLTHVSLQGRVPDLADALLLLPPTVHSFVALSTPAFARSVHRWSCDSKDVLFDTWSRPDRTQRLQRLHTLVFSTPGSPWVVWRATTPERRARVSALLLDTVVPRLLALSRHTSGTGRTAPVCQLIAQETRVLARVMVARVFGGAGVAPVYADDADAQSRGGDDGDGGGGGWGDEASALTTRKAVLPLEEPGVDCCRVASYWANGGDTCHLKHDATRGNCYFWFMCYGCKLTGTYGVCERYSCV